MAIRSIIVPTDYSACSRGALRLAVELAQCLGATVEVVHAWDRPSYVSDVVMTRVDALSPKSLLALIEENARRDLDDFLKSADLPPSTRLVSRLVVGQPTSALLRELELGDYDLVVLGAHGRTGLPHLLLGSFAEKLLRLSPVPVLAVPDAARRGRL